MECRHVHTRAIDMPSATPRQAPGAATGKSRRILVMAYVVMAGGLRRLCQARVQTQEQGGTTQPEPLCACIGSRACPEPRVHALAFKGNDPFRPILGRRMQKRMRKRSFSYSWAGLCWSCAPLSHTFNRHCARTPTRSEKKNTHPWVSAFWGSKTIWRTIILGFQWHGLKVGTQVSSKTNSTTQNYFRALM